MVFKFFTPPPLTTWGSDPQTCHIGRSPSSRRHTTPGGTRLVFVEGIKRKVRSHGYRSSIPKTSPPSIFLCMSLKQRFHRWRDGPWRDGPTGTPPLNTLFLFCVRSEKEKDGRRKVGWIRKLKPVESRLTLKRSVYGYGEGSRTSGDILLGLPLVLWFCHWSQTGDYLVSCPFQPHFLVPNPRLRRSGNKGIDHEVRGS